MIQINKKNKARVLASLAKGRIDAAGVGAPNFIDTILLKAKQRGITEMFAQIVTDKRSGNKAVPLDIIWILSVAAKMKQHTSMDDIPFAITDGETLSELGYAMWDNERDMRKGLMDEGTIRHWLGKYEKKELITGYNRCVQEHIFPYEQIECNIHLLDCTKVDVALHNANYEESSVVTTEDGVRRGYKLATLRGIAGDGGIIEEIRLGTMKDHDLALSRDMLMDSPVLKPGDLLVNDRGFLSREVLNEMKTHRQVDIYVPLRKDMDAYQEAVCLAKAKEKWHAHPNKKRKTQRIALVKDLGPMWRSSNAQDDVPINGCVVWDTKDDSYAVFVTTDTNKTAKQIIQIYEMRPEIEEDYRQLKDFWKLDDFKSTKIHVIAFHIVCTLLGYLLFQLFVATDEGRKWAGHSLPAIVKKYSLDVPKSVIIYVGQYFAVFGFLEFIQLYASLDPHVRSELDGILLLV